MALFKSTIFSQIVNTLAGTVFFYNRYGSIIGRNHVVPTDPNTPAQQTVRTRFSGLVTAWQGLTAAQRNTWEGFAAHTPWKNGLGDDVHLTGFNMYLAIALAALQIDQFLPLVTFSTPPCIPGLYSQPDWSLGPCTSGVLQTGFSINITNTDPTNAIKVGVHRSVAQNTSINFWKGPYDNRAYTVIGPIPPTFTFGVDVLGLTTGKRYFMRFRSLNVTSNNIVSSPWHSYADAAFCIS